MIIIMEEIFDIVDENGEPTGKTVPRSEAHRNGIRHRTAHVWLWRPAKGGFEILLQKRSDDKDSFPGCYDISSAGHIPAGCDYITSALRELKEELGRRRGRRTLFRSARNRSSPRRNSMASRSGTTNSRGSTGLNTNRRWEISSLSRRRSRASGGSRLTE